MGARLVLSRSGGLGGDCPQVVDRPRVHPWRPRIGIRLAPLPAPRRERDAGRLFGPRIPEEVLMKKSHRPATCRWMASRC
jgi:hypothetical protein